MFGKRCFVAALLTIFAFETAAADVLVYRDGRRVRGLVANREQFALSGSSSATVSFLPESASGEQAMLIRVERDSLDHVILESSDGNRVFDMTQGGNSSSRAGAASALHEAPSHPGAITTWQQGTQTNRVVAGSMMAVVGLGIGIFGAAHKFGEEKVIVTSSTVDYQEKSYSAVNYVMMAGGAFMTIMGLVEAGRGSRGPATLVPTDGTTRLAVTVHF